MSVFNTGDLVSDLANAPANLLEPYGIPRGLLQGECAPFPMLPTCVLKGLRLDGLFALTNLNANISIFSNWLRDRLGIFNIFDELGRLIGRSKFGLFSIDLFGLLQCNISFADALRLAGADLYSSPTSEEIGQQITAAQSCFDKYSIGNKNKVRNLSNEDVAGLESELAFLQDQVNLSRTMKDFIARIDAEIAARVKDPTREPVFNPLAPVPISTLQNFTTIATLADLPEPTEVFRLTYGPPISNFGRFLLSNDGIYFDSQSDSVSGLTVAFTEVSRRKAEQDSIFSSLFWKFEQDPNTGGRGKGLSLKQIKQYVDNILDIDRVDDSNDLLEYYDSDNYLEQLTAHKNKRIYDTSSLISEMEANRILNESSVSLAEIENTKQALMSEIASFSEKEKKRKKQIELAVRLGNAQGETPRYRIGEVPLNDFSYLEGTSFWVDIQKQRALTLDHDDIGGIILPISATYIVPPKDQTSENIDHLLLSMIGEGNILESASSFENDKPTILAAETRVTKDNLIAIYNFLETHIESASSTEYLLDNCISSTLQGRNQVFSLNARLISDSLQSLFPKGLGIPYLNGIVKFNSTGSILGFNNHIVLPSMPEFNDLFYNPSGATIDLWLHVPNVIPTNQGTVQQMYKIIIGNENTGGDNLVTDINYVPYDRSPNTVRGLLIGFTRDRRITLNASASNLDVSNPGQFTHFFIAPTQSVNGSSIAFVNRSSVVTKTDDACTSIEGPICFKVPISSTTESGYALSSLQNSFGHLSISVNPTQDNISVYLNGEVLASSSITNTFQVVNSKTLNVPSFFINRQNGGSSNSFRYTSEYPNINQNIKYGLPFNNSNQGLGRAESHQKFTPWIVGSGFTDGLPYGNFMGSTYSGQRSALDGYVGSLKFYNKSLNLTEIVNNYKAQSQFFLNIKV